MNLYARTINPGELHKVSQVNKAVVIEIEYDIVICITGLGFISSGELYKVSQVNIAVAIEIAFHGGAGPHRDDLRFLSNRIDLGVYGSRGQVRTALLTLKLAEVAWMKSKTGHWPVALLDEVLAELDLARRDDLLARVGECKQALLTTTDLNLFNPEFVQQAQLWRIKAGRVVLE